MLNILPILLIWHCLSVWLHPCQFSIMISCLPSYIPINLHTCWLAYIPSCLYAWACGNIKTPTSIGQMWAKVDFWILLRVNLIMQYENSKAHISSISNVNSVIQNKNNKTQRQVDYLLFSIKPTKLQEKLFW